MDGNVFWSILMRIAIGLLLLKILWNGLVPYHLIRMEREGKPEAGVSVFPLIEIALLLCVIVLAALAKEGDLTPGRLGLCGVATILLSYLHIFAVGFGRGLWRRHLARRKRG